MGLAKDDSALEALQLERGELLVIEAMMRKTVPQLADALGAWRDDLEAGFKDAADPFAAERHLELATKSLRHIWLRTAASSTSKAYRSPAGTEMKVTQDGRFHDFGYERDLQPNALEGRCARFFADTGGGDHVIFSSGQAAMTALLTYIASTRSGQEPLRVCHLGAYFETRDLLSLFGSRFETVGPESGCEVVLAEPVWCDGETFGANDSAALAAFANRKKPRAVVVDSTLAGLDDDFLSLREALDPAVPLFRVHSGMKLFQAGLELADVGIVSVYRAAAGDNLRHIRTLHGSGLRFADVAALDVPLFLDREATLVYERAVFANNAALARALARTALFGSSDHPSLCAASGRAPFCIFTLRDPGASYEDLERRILEGARRRGLVLDMGGSFGFRGHRFEVVRPEGRAPFLRVALGRREGPSLQGVIALLDELAA
jgi:hypothetical protein